MRRLQEMRDIADLTPRFGPYKEMTFGQVAMNHPEYIRQLVNGRATRGPRCGQASAASHPPNTDVTVIKSAPR